MQNVKEKNPMWGRHHTKETKEKMRLKKKGKKPYEMTDKIRKKMSKSRIGKYIGRKNGNWKGKERITGGGYWYVYKALGKYVKKANLVMEKKIGKFLKKDEVVHHINEIKTDDSSQNLYLMRNRSQHANYHKNVVLTYKEWIYKKWIIK